MAVQTSCTRRSDGAGTRGRREGDGGGDDDDGALSPPSATVGWWRGGSEATAAFKATANICTGPDKEGYGTSRVRETRIWPSSVCHKAWHLARAQAAERGGAAFARGS